MIDDEDTSFVQSTGQLRQVEAINWKHEAARINIEAACRHLLPTGVLRRDGEYYATNPNRADGSLGSFKINIQTGRWSDFADHSGRAAGRDIISYWAYVRGVNNSTAVKQIHDELYAGSPPDRPPQALNLETQDVVIMPVPDDAPLPANRCGHPKLGIPDMVFRYSDEDFRLLAFVCRWDAGKLREKKEIRPLIYMRSASGTCSWKFAAPELRPFYGLQRLHKGNRIIIVEGERKADAAQMVCSKDSWIGWMGGAASISKIDITPLVGTHQPIILWPDRSKVGIAAMDQLAQRIRDIGLNPVVMRYPPDADLSEDWDVADAIETGWTESDINAFIIETTVARKVETTPRIDGYHPVSGWPLTYEGKDGQSSKLNCIENTEHMYAYYGIRIRYNEMRRQLDLTFPRSWSVRAPESLAQSRMKRELKNIASKNHFPKNDLNEWIGAICEQNAFHPFREWSDPKIEGEVWDGRDHLSMLVDTIRSPLDRREVHAKILRWMLSGVALAYRERTGPRGTQPVAHGVLTLVGGQGIGKTSWFSSLVPPSMVRVGASLHPDKKDSHIECTNRFIVEWGEADSMNRDTSDIGAIKAHVTMPYDMIRMPYAENAIEYPRMTIYCASVNNTRFLNDDENRRWWIIPVDSMIYDHNVNIRQVWAQIVVLYRAGEQWHLTADECQATAETNLQHRRISPIEEAILSRYDWASVGRWEAKTPTDLVRDIGYLSPTRLQIQEAGAVLSRLAREKITSTVMRHGYKHYRIPRLVAAYELVDSPRRLSILDPDAV